MKNRTLFLPCVSLPLIALILLIPASPALAVWAGHGVVTPEPWKSRSSEINEIVQQYQVQISQSDEGKVRAEIRFPQEHMKPQDKQFYMVTTREPLDLDEMDLRTQLSAFAIWQEHSRLQRENEEKQWDDLEKQLRKDFPPEEVEKRLKLHKKIYARNADRTGEEKLAELPITEVRKLTPELREKEAVLQVDLEKETALRSYIIWDFAFIVEESGIVMDGGLYLTIDLAGFVRQDGKESESAE